MKIVKEFSRFAEEYQKHNRIQVEVASKLTSMLDSNRYKKVLDLGCGSGAIYENLIKNSIIVDEFIAFDFSKEMLELHPTAFNIEKICADFNNQDSFIDYKNGYFDMVISASALQWSKDLSKVLKTISLLSERFYFSFFTSKTFNTLHEIAGVTSPIYSMESILEKLNRDYNYKFEVVEYKLYFNSVLEMLRYIKRSGVSGGTNKLSYREMKRLMREYPLDYLEFEVLFVNATKS